MKKSLLCFVINVLLLAPCFADCIITKFRWECEIPVQRKPSSSIYSLVYCGDTPLYVNKMQFALLARIQRADINQVLKINDEYIDSPCIPASLYLKYP